MKRAILPLEFREAVRGLPKGVRREIGATISSLEQAFGRLVFQNLPKGLHCEMIGSHDQVKRFIRSR